MMSRRSIRRKQENNQKHKKKHVNTKQEISSAVEGIKTKNGGKISKKKKKTWDEWTVANERKITTKDTQKNMKKKLEKQQTWTKQQKIRINTKTGTRQAGKPWDE